MKAVIFPGQSSQYIGMGKSLYENFSQAKEVFSSIDGTLGFELSKKCFDGSEEDLKDTSIQQLAILAVSLASFSVLKSKNIDIKYLSGLSLGEYSCLYAGEVLSLEDLVILVKKRSEAMQRAAGMSSATMFAVIGLDRVTIETKSKELGFYIANLNSPQQIVISLSKDIKENVKGTLESLGAKVVELAVSGGFHSPFMEPAKEVLAGVINSMDFKDSKIPIVSNFTAKAHTAASQIKSNLLDQLVSSVLWNDCADLMISEGCGLFYEAGPSRVLRGLMRKINPSVKVINLEKKEDFDGLDSAQGGK